MRIPLATVALLLLVSISPLPQDLPSLAPQSDAPPSEEIPTLQDDEIAEPLEEDDSMFYDQEIFSRKLFQKTLPPLSGREKIVWSFRMATPDPFL